MGVDYLKTWIFKKMGLFKQVDFKALQQNGKEVVVLADATHVVIPPRTHRALETVLVDYIELKKHIDHLCKTFAELGVHLFLYFETDPLDTVKLK